MARCSGGGRAAAVLTGVAWAFAMVWRCAADGAASGRIVSIGDLHGDFDHAVAILRASGLAEVVHAGDGAVHGDPPYARYRGVRWTGGDATLVQTGDLVDRGTYARDLYALFQELRKQAPLAGGRVINLLGNHEVMMLSSDLRYVTKKDYRNFGGMEKRKEAFEPDGLIGKQLLGEFQAAALVGDTVFVHAGLLPADATQGIDKLNEEARRAVTSVVKKGRYAMSKEEGKLLGATGPFWVRRLADKSEQSSCPLLEETLHLVGARRMVVGHTQVEEGRVRPRCGGRLLMADTIISQDGYPMCWGKGSRQRAGCTGSMSFVEVRGPDAFARLVEADGEQGWKVAEETLLPTPPPPGPPETVQEL